MLPYSIVTYSLTHLLVSLFTVCLCCYELTCRT